MRNRILFLIIALMLINASVYSQYYRNVDKLVIETYPKSIKKLEQLTDLINQDFSLQDEKARAIFTWIAYNIDYDVEAESSLQKRYSFSDSSQIAAIERKIRAKWAKNCVKESKAECEGYATLYKCFCDLVSVECVIIPGNTKRHENHIGDPELKTNHAWNAVKIDDEWKFVDPTWGAGYIDYSSNTFYRIIDNTYFLSDPDRYFYNHFPADNAYLFTDRTAQEYIDLPLYYSEFLKLDYEIIEPQTGILQIKGEDIVSFKMKSEKGVEFISYAFDEEDDLQDVKVYKENEDYVFKIQFPAEQKGILNLFYKRRGFVTYKIENI
jgi:transglutaminase/protease-like cytokinesis protein 3